MNLGIIQNTLMAVILSLAILMMFERWYDRDSSNQIFILQREIEQRQDEAFARLEAKIDRVSDLSDSYQINTANKIILIEKEVEALASRQEED